MRYHAPGPATRPHAETHHPLGDDTGPCWLTFARRITISDAELRSVGGHVGHVTDKDLDEAGISPQVVFMDGSVP